MNRRLESHAVQGKDPDRSPETYDSPPVKTRKLRELTVQGTPGEIGFQHGRAFKTEIHRFLNDDLARINLLREIPLARNKALHIAGRYARCVEHEVPEIAEEIAGLAKGAGIDYLEAMLLQVRREIIASRSAADCTTVGSWTDTSYWLAQTVDLAGDMTDLAVILRIVPSHPGSPTICMFTFIGLSGYLGMNESGLAIGINMLHSPGWRPGVSPYILMRHLLGKTSAAEALEEIQRIRRASSRFFMLADSRGLLGVEMTVNNHRTLCARRLVHTNHFIHPELVDHERNTSSGIKNSKIRFDRALELLDGGHPAESILRDHENYPRSICFHGNADIRVPRTTAAVVLKPAERLLRAVAGSPCENPFQTFPLRDESLRNPAAKADHQGSLPA
jgi:isopenicillin-N N-acyltransferase like protein